MDTTSSIRVLLTGATGFIGQALVLKLARNGVHVTALVRDLEKASSLPCEKILWNGKSTIQGLSEKPRFDAVIHLAGEPIASTRWNESIKKSLWDSRVDSTRSLVKSICDLEESKRPQVFLSGSAIGIYGERGDEELHENSKPGSGFLADLCAQWEAEALKLREYGVRVVTLRTGIVLGRGGGALEKMKPAVLGDGSQWMSWIHIDDAVGLIEFAMQNQKISGPINLTAPAPVTNKKFTELLRETLGSFYLPPVPTFALKAALGEMSQVILASQRVLSVVSSEHKYNYKFESLDSALKDIYVPHFPGEKGDHEFQAYQFIARPIQEVFSFFSKAENLEVITPEFIGFKVLGKSTPEIEEGTLIDYKLNIHSLPVKWRTRIENWSPPAQFVDTQLKGPYTKWHHTHTFETVPGGTLMCDRVFYRVPVGRLGSLIAGNFVKKDVNEIFSYRRKKIREIFK